MVSLRAFIGRADLDGLVQCAWRGANDGVELQAAERLNSWRVAEAAPTARART